MCYNCGCGNSSDNMGHEDNITEETFHYHLVEKLQMSGKEIKLLVFTLLKEQVINKDFSKKNSLVEETFKKAAKAWGQSIDEAKKYTYEMLKNELEKQKK